jgi:pimeloyl-ACP methyl ester carboxylesterase
VLPPLSIPGNIGLTLAKAEVSNAIYGQTGASYLPFINTPFTAQDMLRIVDAHGFENINYYGISAGTILGMNHARLLWQS